MQPIRKSLSILVAVLAVFCFPVLATYVSSGKSVGTIGDFSMATPSTCVPNVGGVTAGDTEEVMYYSTATTVDANTITSVRVPSWTLVTHQSESGGPNTIYWYRGTATSSGAELVSVANTGSFYHATVCAEYTSSLVDSTSAVNSGGITTNMTTHTSTDNVGGGNATAGGPRSEGHSSPDKLSPMQFPRYMPFLVITTHRLQELMALMYLERQLVRGQWRASIHCTAFLQALRVTESSITKMKTILKLALLIIICTRLVHAATYYVSYSLGSDSYDGTEKAHTTGTTGPFKHAPGMLGLTTTNTSTGDQCTANCASYTPVAGDSIILYGGDIWAYTALPWNFTWAGSGTTSAYGCTGSGCIYIGYDATWNKGIVNSVTLTRDLGGCNPSSPPTVSFSGGGGTGAAATALVIPSAQGTAEPNVAGFVYHVVVTNQGSGYTSNPTVSISGGGCVGIAAVADIYRPVIDAGGKSDLSGYTWGVGYQPNNSLGINSPGLTFNNPAKYVIVDHLEIRNIQQFARWSTASGCVNNGGTIQTAMLYDEYGSSGTNTFDTFENNYLHGRFASCNTGNATSQQDADAGIISSATDEVKGNVLENGESFWINSADTCNGVTNCPSIFSESGIQGAGYIHNNIEYSIAWMVHGGSNAVAPFIIANNEMWLALYAVGGAHINELYEQGTVGTMYEYNNIFHSAVSGASNQQQMGNGTTQYFFNNVSWGLGGGTSNWGIDAITSAGASGGHFYFFNNTMQGEGNGVRNCIDGSAGSFASALNVVLQNNHCITAANPYWVQPATSNYTNQSGSTVQTTITASSTVQSNSTATSQGYLESHLFAPVGSSNSTVQFTTNANTANLPTLCAGLLTSVVTACEEDILGNARPSSGGWQAGAYLFSGSLPTAANPSCSPGTGSYTGTQTVTCSTSSSGAIIVYTTDGSTPSTNGNLGPSNGILYIGPISVPASITLKFVAGGAGYLDSGVVTYTYSISGPPTAATTTCIPVGGIFTSTQTVNCSVAGGAPTIVYTTDGTTPVISPLHGTVYSTALTVSSTATLKLIAGGTGFTPGAVQTYVYTITLPPAGTPVCTPVSGTYPQAQTVSCSVSIGTTMRYTTNGTTPSVSGSVGTLYTGPITVSSTEVLNIVAGDGSHIDGSVASYSYTITQPNNGAPWPLMAYTVSGLHGGCSQCPISALCICHAADGDWLAVSGSQYAQIGVQSVIMNGINKKATSPSFKITGKGVTVQ